MKAATVPMRQRRPMAARKKKTPFFQRVEFILGLLILLGLPGAFGVYATQSAQFKVQRVLFEGVHMLDENEILRASQITEADNILMLDGDAVKARVEALPYVRRCEVKRMYPNEVLLRIVERRPIATIMVNNHLYEIDREFVVLRELAPFAVYSGPLITSLPDVVVLDPGTQLDIPELNAALALWEVFQTLPFAADLRLSELSAENEGQLRMFFEEIPYEMRWGRSDFETQANRLAILWDELNGLIPCEVYLDLRFDADLVCK